MREREQMEQLKAGQQVVHIFTPSESRWEACGCLVADLIKPRTQALLWL